MYCPLQQQAGTHGYCGSEPGSWLSSQPPALSLSPQCHVFLQGKLVTCFPSAPGLAMRNLNRSSSNAGAGLWAYHKWYAMHFSCLYHVARGNLASLTRFEIWIWFEPSRQIKSPGVRNPQEQKPKQSDHMRCLGSESTESCIAPAVWSSNRLDYSLGPYS